MDHVIATERLTRRFGRLEAVNELTLHVPVGSIFGQIGPPLTTALEPDLTQWVEPAIRTTRR